MCWSRCSVTFGIQAQDKIIAPVWRRIRNAHGYKDAVSRPQQPHQGNSLPRRNPDLRCAESRAFDTHPRSRRAANASNVQGVSRAQLKGKQEQNHRLRRSEVEKRQQAAPRRDPRLELQNTDRGWKPKSPVSGTTRIHYRHHHIYRSE